MNSRNTGAMTNECNPVRVEKDQVQAAVRRRIYAADSVLDIGPGIRPQRFVEPRVHICVEPHAPYLDRLRESLADESGYVFLNCEWGPALRLMPADAVDSVFAIDLIEHLDKEAGVALLREAERVARRQIVVFTPLGFYPQSYAETGEKDRWGMEGGYWQTHRSGWEPEDFGPGWNFVVCERFHDEDQHGQALARPHGAFWAFRNLAPPPAMPAPRPVAHAHGALRRIVSRIARLARFTAPPSRA